ncbi:MAG: ATP-grasp domain-containing protein [Nocardioides sp.]|nr:ATP-grasp domain-containing protein [Nocardioides sp.]
MRSLVVLGGADGAIPTLEAAHRVGLHTICVDQRTDAPAVSHADEFLSISTHAVDELVSVLTHRPDVCGVTSPASDVNLPTCAALARRLGLPSGLSADALRASVDKGFFRSVCDGQGLPGPGYVQGPAAEVVASAASLATPVIVKPTDSSGGRGIAVCTTHQGLPQAVAEAAEHSRSGVVIVEEYFEGDHYTAEAILCDDEIRIFALGRRTLTPQPHFVTLEHRMPSCAALTADVRRQLSRVCRALGYRWGALNADVLVRPSGDVVLIEMGARPGGNGSAELLGHVHGLDLTEAFVQMSVGDTPTLVCGAPRHALFHAFGAPTAGKLLALEGVEEIESMPEVAELVLAANPGEFVEPYHRAGAKVGYVLVTADDEHGVANAMDRVEQLLRVEVLEDVGELA